ncbi:MAG: hypothetical protein FJX75_10285 [Armatimonadetes bacterium]|nr:hypothetical protein [Armatimonadota bacterium]
MSLAADYLAALDANLDAVIAHETPQLRAAAALIAEALREGHRAYEYLAGHLMPYESAVGRRGRHDLLLPLAENETDRLQPGDVLVMTHQYGVLERYVDVAIAAKERGARIIAIAPPSDPAKIIRTHPTQTWVGDYAEIAIDTHIPEGDVALAGKEGHHTHLAEVPPNEYGVPLFPGACPTSGVIQALVHWMLVCAVAERRAR